MSSTTPAAPPDPPPDATPEEIEADIEASRERLASSVDALTAKLDVKAQAKQKAQETSAQAKQKARETSERVGAGAQHAYERVSSCRAGLLLGDPGRNRPAGSSYSPGDRAVAQRFGAGSPVWHTQTERTSKSATRRAVRPLATSVRADVDRRTPDRAVGVLAGCLVGRQRLQALAHHRWNGPA